jgi:hypothetical protein
VDRSIEKEIQLGTVHTIRFFCGELFFFGEKIWYESRNARAA